MLLVQLVTAASLASISSAFLLPPQISASDADIINTLSFEHTAAMNERVVALEFPGSADNDLLEFMHYKQEDSILMMNMTIAQHDNGADMLLLNNLPIYPISIHQAAERDSLSAEQIFQSPKLGSKVVSLRYSMSANHLEIPLGSQIRLTKLRINIVEVEERFILGVPSIEITLLETLPGKLIVGDIKIVAAFHEARRQCTTLLCKWRAVLAANIPALRKGCGNHPHQVISDGHRRHGYSHIGRKHHGHHFRHSSIVAGLLRGLVLHVFLPIVIGVLVGISASLVGMVVGHLAIFVWRFAFRGSRSNNYTRLQHATIIQEVDDEIKPTIDAQAPPPAYIETVAGEKA